MCMGLKGDLGRDIVAYELMRNGWHVYANYGSMIESKHERQGVDIIARKGKRDIRMEVKLRDRFNSPQEIRAKFILPILNLLT